MDHKHVRPYSSHVQALVADAMSMDYTRPDHKNDNDAVYDRRTFAVERQSTTYAAATEMKTVHRLRCLNLLIRLSVCRRWQLLRPRPILRQCQTFLCTPNSLVLRCRVPRAKYVRYFSLRLLYVQ